MLSQVPFVAHIVSEEVPGFAFRCLDNPVTFPKTELAMGLNFRGKWARFLEVMGSNFGGVGFDFRR